MPEVFKPALSIFTIADSGLLDIRYTIGSDASNRMVWKENGIKIVDHNALPFKDDGVARFGFDYIQFYDGDTQRLRASTFVWAGLLTYKRGAPDITIALQVHSNILRAHRRGSNRGEDGTVNLYGRIEFKISRGAVFDADGSVRVAAYTFDSPNLGGTAAAGSAPTSLLKLSTPQPWNGRWALIDGTYPDSHSLSSPQFDFLRSLLRDASANLPVRDGFISTSPNLVKVAFGPLGLNPGHMEGRPFGFFGFGTSVSVGQSGTTGSATLALDPNPERARINPRIEFREPLTVSVIQDVHNSRTGYSDRPVDASKFGSNLFWYVFIEKVPAAAFAHVWNELVARPYLAALRTVDDNADLSFVPLLDLKKIVAPRDSTFDVLFDLVQDTPKDHVGYDKDEPDKTPATPAKDGSAWNKPIAIGMRPSAETTSFDADAVFPGLITHAGKEVRRRVKVTVERGRGEWFDSSPGLDVPAEIVMRIAATAGDGEAGKVRLGALDLDVPVGDSGEISIVYRVIFTPASASSTKQSRASSDPKGKADRPRLPRWGEAIPRINATIERFGLNSVQPGSQDPVPDASRSFDAILREPARGVVDPNEIMRRTARENRIANNLRREAPIVIVDRPKASSSSEYFLTGQEINEDNRDRRLGLTLRHRNQSQSRNARETRGPQRTIVIDREPFTVALVDVPAFELLSDESAETDGEVANWETSELEGGRWEIARVTDGFDLFFPPQATGEAAEKGLPWQPISPGGNTGQTVDYRVGTLARLNLLSSYFRQRYAEAPWNLRRVLGYAGQRAPGAGLNTARFEFLYGLAARFTGSGMRLAELGSRIGAIRDPLPARPANIRRDASTPGQTQSVIETEIYDGFRDVAAAFSKSYNTRIAVFEAYKEGSVDALSLEDRVAFTLRLKGSENADIHPQPWNAYDTGQTGLRGGATWGFESRNIYEEVVTDKAAESTRGQILSPSFSALGGSGFVRAFFANGKSRIVSDTRFGRTHTYAVERIGRIGVFWNIAKHVIVYERTVLPSDQFEADQQGQHFGRPVLRKVREYVDILEPERAFPENGAAVKTRGFVEACAFRTRRIPVSGRWGHDIKDGWVVPLWKEGADPDIYPKPDLRLWLTPAHTDSAAKVDGRFTDPSQVVFFTSTVKTHGDNPNLWPAHPEVDIDNTPKPAPKGEASIDPNNPDGRAPDDLMRDPLLRRCTFDIDTSGLAANLVSGRPATDPIGAVVETVTLMRATPTGESGGEAANGLKLRQELEQIGSEVKRLETALGDAMIDGRRALDRLTQLVGTLDPGRIKEAIRSEIGRVTNLKAVIRRAAADARVAVGEAAKRAEDYWQAGRGKWTDHTTAVLDRFKQATEAALTGRIDRLLADIDEVKADVVNFAAGLPPPQAVLLARRIDGALAPLRTTITASFASFGEAVRKIDDSARLVGTELKLAQQTVARLAAEAKKRLPKVSEVDWKRLTDEYTAFHAAALRAVDRAVQVAGRQLPRELKEADAISGAQKKIIKFLTGVRSTLVAEHETAMSDIAKAKGNYVTARAKAVEAIDKAVTATEQLSTRAGDLETYVETNITGKLRTALQKFTKELEKELDRTDSTAVLGKIYAACGKNEQIDKVVNAVGAELDTFRRQIVNLRGDVVATSIAIRTLLGEFLDEVGADLGAVEAKLKEQIDKATALANTEIKILEDTLINGVDTVVAELEKAEANTNQLADRIADAADSIRKGAEDIGKTIQTAIPPEMANSLRVLEEGYKRLKEVPTFQNPNETLALIRAAGSSPLLPNLKFNRDRIAYFFDDVQDAVRTTPVIALMNRVGDDLKALGIRLPTGALLDRLIPSGLEKIDFGKLFPDLGGLKLDGLFKELRLPLNDNVKITHGFDKVSLTAWAKAEARSNLPPRSEVFNLGPLKLDIVNASFDALADLAAGTDGHVRRKTSGQIVGDWELGFGGRALITLERTKVSFEDGRGLDVDIDPTRVRFDSAVKFLSDVIKSYGDPNSGFFLEMLEEGGVPAGLAARIELPMPPLSFGAFSVWGLRFSSAFALHLVKGQGGKGGDFALGTQLALGRRSEPFLLRVWILVGGGWLDTEAKYFPATGKISSKVSIGLTAGLGLDFAFGPCCGYVFAMLGVSAEFESQSDGPTHLAISVIFLVRGGIVILGRFNIGLHLLLELIYQDDGSAIGRGTLEVTFTICWCCKIKVRQGITYYLKKGSGAQLRAAGQPHYLDSFA